MLHGLLLHSIRRRYTRGLPPNTAPQPSALARDLAELSQRSALVQYVPQAILLGGHLLKIYFCRRYTRGLPPNTAPQPSALARDLAELSQRSVSGAEAAARQPSPDGTPRTAPLQLEHWRLLEGGEALPVCRDSVRLCTLYF